MKSSNPYTPPALNSNQPEDAELALADEREALDRRIREIEDLISTAPERMNKARRERLVTIPPPESEGHELYRHPVTGLTAERPLMRRQAAAQQAARRKNMLVFMIAAILFTVFSCWISQSL